MAQIVNTIAELEKLDKTQIVDAPFVRDNFIRIWETLWGEGSGEAAYERESSYFNKLLRDNTELQKGTKFSIFTAFIDLAVCGLSLEQGVRALAYLQTRNYNVGTKSNASYETRTVLTISGYGELVMRVRCGQIRHADNPVIVYANDKFSFSDEGGGKMVRYTCNLPHTGQPIVACYMRITRNDGTLDYAIMLEEDWCRLARYSYNNNMYYDRESKQRVSSGSNALYGVDKDGKVNIDPGFLMAKCIKHAFKTYPKVRIGRGTEFESQQEEQPTIEINDDLYGGVPESGITETEQPEAFGNNEPQSGTTVEPEDDGAF